MLIVSHFAAFCLAFSTKIPCVLHQIALHLAPKRTAFSTKTYCIWHQNALHFAVNSPKTGATGGCFKYIFILPYSQTSTFLHQN